MSKMVQRVLVLEKKQETAERLVAALRQNGPLTVSLVPTMREACLIVARQSQDLAFIPLEDADQLLHSLRALQSDLKMILTTADSHARISPQDGQVFQGLLHTNSLETELPSLLSEYQLPSNLRQPDHAEPVWTPGLARFQKACQEVGLASGSSLAQTAVLSFEEQLIGFCGRGNESEATAVVDLMSRSWQKGHCTVQLQYLQLSDYYDARLIYSRAVAGTVLSLVAEPEVSITDLRKLADRMAHYLSGIKNEANETPKSGITGIGRSNGFNPEEKPPTTFAIAWRPIKPLPAILLRVVHDTILVLVKENGSRLRHLSVTPTIIHLVIACPAGKTAAWAVYTLKSGVNEEIQRQFGTQTSIWHKGSYATESDQPLNEAELNILLAP